MAKTGRRRYYRKKGRWSSNISQLANTIISVPSDIGFFSGSTTLATNPVQSNLGVSQVYTVKNFETSFTIDSNATPEAIESITAFIMFVPQGMNVTENYPMDHPEFIMNYRYLGSPTLDAPTSQAAPYKLKTRLSRKLNTGDSIILLIRAYHTQGSQTTMAVHGLVRWWTKAN